MRIITAFCIVSLVLSVSADIPKGSYALPRKKNVKIYANEVRGVFEKHILTVGLDDRLYVLDARKNHYKVKIDEQIGWVEKGLVTAAKRSKKYTFDGANVLGYLDNPAAFFILDTEDPDPIKIKLDRSSKENLKEHVDRETIDRALAK